MVGAGRGGGAQLRGGPEAREAPRGGDAGGGRIYGISSLISGILITEYCIKSLILYLKFLNWALRAINILSRVSPVESDIR